jgi:hypothetical protein
MFKRFTFSWLSPLLGFHAGRNPISGRRFLHVAPIPFIGIDFGERLPESNGEGIFVRFSVEGIIPGFPEDEGDSVAVDAIQTLRRAMESTGATDVLVEETTV